MSVTVVSRNPPGGRCTLYARYAEALSSHYNLTVDIPCPGEKPSDGPPPPSLVIRGQHVVPSDGVIVAPEDIVVVLGTGWGGLMSAALNWKVSWMPLLQRCSCSAQRDVMGITKKRHGRASTGGNE